MSSLAVAPILRGCSKRLATRICETAEATAISGHAQFRLRSQISALAGYAEDAAAAASRTPLPGTDGGGAPQNDLLSPLVQAWTKHIAAVDLLSTSAATLRTIAARVGRSVDLDPRGLDLALRTQMSSAVCVPSELAGLHSELHWRT